MRVVQICFQLHESYALSDFDVKNDTSDREIAGYAETEKRFREDDEKIYQPLLAFLERNTQKYSGFKVSLQISGIWLEQAERYDIKLVQRLKKLIKAGRVELVAEPYYHSLAVFWNKDELATQVEQYREKIDQLFGVKGRVFAMPDLCYDNAMGKWVEENGFAGMLIAGEQRVLGWRNVNHVYEAAGCEYLRLLVVNEALSRMIAEGDERILAEKKVEEDGEIKLRQVFSLEKFVKELDLSTLRGGLVNLYFDASLLATQRRRGVIGFLDELVELLNAGKKGDKMVGAAEACVVDEPKMELTIEKTVARGDLKNVREVETKQNSSGMELVLKSEVKSELPLWLSGEQQKMVQDTLYGLRREILASEDNKLIADFRRLLAVDYMVGLDEARIEGFRKIWSNLKRRAAEVKKSQAVEISRNYTKRRDRGDVGRVAKRPVQEDASGAVKVNFVSRAQGGGGVSSHELHAKGDVKVRMADDAGEMVAVRRVILEGPRVAEKSAEIDEAKEIAQAVEEPQAANVQKIQVTPKKTKKHTIRKIIKKLVIE